MSPCPVEHRPGLERALDLDLRMVATRLEALMLSADRDLEDGGLAGAIDEAMSKVEAARQVLAGRRS